MSDLDGADSEMLTHIAAFRARGHTEPHPDCTWCAEAKKRGLWDCQLPRYRVTLRYEAVVDVAAFNGVHARERAWLKANPDITGSEAVRDGEWEVRP